LPTCLVNKSIVSLLNQVGGKAVGLTGKDADLILAKPLHLANRAADALGFVGQVNEINTGVIHKLQEQSFIPIIAPIGTDSTGASYNINADLVASAVASALKATRLLLLTNTPGILDKQGNLLTGITPSHIESLIDDGTIHGGMLPKVQCALDAVKAGVGSVQIIDGPKNSHTFLNSECQNSYEHSKYHVQKLLQLLSGSS